MDRIQIVLTEGRPIRRGVPVINGSPLPQLLRFAFHERVDWDGIPADALVRTLLNHPGYRGSGRVLLLEGEFENSSRASVTAEVIESDTHVEWRDFRGPEVDQSAPPKLRGFVFDRVQYEAALATPGCERGHRSVVDRLDPEQTD